MNTKYEDFYSQYKLDHGNAKKAYSFANNYTVFDNLKNNANSALEVIISSYLNQQTDSYSKLFDELISILERRVTNLVAFAESYKAVESAYVELKEECDTLKNADKKLVELCRSKPSSRDRKYKIANTDPPEYNYSAYYSDKSRWEKKVIALKKDCSSLSNNISDYISYLTEANNCIARGGAIKTNTIKPTKLGDTPEYNQIMVDESGNLAFGYYLEGEELIQFLTDNNIPNEDYVKIYKDVAYINSVQFPIYKVYDIDCSAEENKGFEEYIQGCLKYESYIAPAVLERIKNGGSSLIFEQTYRCDGGSLENERFDYSAYCNSTNRNIVQFYHDSDDEYYLRSIVHETGHAYDFTLRYENTGETTASITHLDANTVTQYSDANIMNSYTVDDQGNLYTWDRLIQEEVGYFDSSHKDYPCTITKRNAEEAHAFFSDYCLGGQKVDEGVDETGNYYIKVSYENTLNSEGVTVGGGSSVYNVHDYMTAPHEYFADSFQAYWIGDDRETSDGGISRFEYLCPETYRAMDNLIQQDINAYQRGM